MTLSRFMRISAALILAYTFVYAVVPFSTAALNGGRLTGFASGVPDGRLHFNEFLTTTAGRSDCSAAVIDAWHAKPPPTGWFGYAPLSGTSVVLGTQCRSASQRRLQLAFVGIFVGIALLLAARAVDRRSGFGLDPPPAPAP